MRTSLRNLIIASLACGALTLSPIAASALNEYIKIALALFGVIPVIILWVAILVWSVVLAVKIGPEWRIAWLSPLIPIVTFVASLWSIPYVQFSIDYLHFSAMRRSYDDVVAASHDNGHRFEEFNWGGMLFASRGVVYDETDEVALPYGHQSPSWKYRMKSTDLTCGGDGPVGEVMPLGSHYYVVSFGC